ncbi:MAG: DUF4388 domain-containing protein, partial [Acidimicrobiia bacterium]|nr:DUF4388 domain-containing protein [Acidimicrobiia bacterium]
MTIRGSLEEASLPDFLQLLALGQKTGRLSVSDRSHLGYIFLESGRIVSATLVNRPDRLGDVLVKHGEITTAQLEAAIETQSGDRDRKVGAILVEHGAISRSVLERYVRRQIEEAIYFLLTWQRGEIVFERGVAPDSDEFLVSIDPDRILLEGARRTDEWTVIEKEIPSLDAVFVLDRERFDAADVPRTEELERIVNLLDGTRNANQIIDDTGLSPFEVGKVLYDLVTAGCAQPMRRPSGEVVSAPAGPNEASDHLDFPQLERYLSRTGEFAREEKRKSAAHHIVDCRTCTVRLSKVNQRRTGTSPAVPEQPVGEAASPSRPVLPEETAAATVKTAAVSPSAPP